MKNHTHKFKDEVDVVVILGLEDVIQADDVFVVSQLLQEHDFTEGSLSISGVLECIKDLFQSNGFARFLVGSLPHNTIGLRRVC